MDGWQAGWQVGSEQAGRRSGGQAERGRPRDEEIQYSGASLHPVSRPAARAPPLARLP